METSMVIYLHILCIGFNTAVVHSAWVSVVKNIELIVDIELNLKRKGRNCPISDYCPGTICEVIPASHESQDHKLPSPPLPSSSARWSRLQNRQTM